MAIQFFLIPRGQEGDWFWQDPYTAAVGPLIGCSIVLLFALFPL